MRRRLPLALAALLVAGPASAASRVLPNVPAIEQEHDQWCWVGVTRCALEHFGVTPEQCEIAEWSRTHNTSSSVDFGPAECCTDWTQGCNSPNWFWNSGGSVAEILAAFGGLEYRTYERPLALGDVVDAIDASRLVFVRWDWNRGGGHFVVVYGYDDSLLHHMNPWPGEGLKLAEHSWLLSGDTHTWATSLTTGKPDACKALADGAACDDGDLCTRQDRCAAGACAGTPIDCGCRACDGATGTCLGTAPDGQPCSDGDACTGPDTCASGACRGQPRICEAPAECRAAGQCDPSGGCTYAPLPDGVACSQGRCRGGVCDPGPSCSAAGGGPLGLLGALGALALSRRRRGLACPDTAG